MTSSAAVNEPRECFDMRLLGEALWPRARKPSATCAQDIPVSARATLILDLSQAPTSMVFRVALTAGPGFYIDFASAATDSASGRCESEPRSESRTYSRSSAICEAGTPTDRPSSLTCASSASLIRPSA